MKELNGKYLNLAIANYMKMFYEEDEYYPDYRKVRLYERHYYKDLEKATPIKEEQEEVQKIIEGGWCGEISLAKLLEKEGYKIIKGDKQ